MHCSGKIKLLSAAALAALILTAAGSSAWAEDGHEVGNFLTDEYQGGQSETKDGHEIGNFPSDDYQSQQSGEEDGGVSDTAGKPVALSNGVYYDPDADIFYFFTENNRFGMNVPNGVITTGSVRTDIPPALTAALYKSGTKLENAELSCIDEPGKYVLSVFENDATKAVRVNFTILSSPTGEIKEYTMPPDFFVVSATHNGEEAVYSQTHVDMKADGDYVISYRSPEADKDLLLAVTIDHTPPTAVISGLKDGKANGPVTISGLEEGVKAYLTRNGRDTAFTETVNETGVYVLTLKDPAGNKTVYDFVVVTYVNISLKLLLAMGAVLLLALAGYLLYYKKYIRVS